MKTADLIVGEDYAFSNSQPGGRYGWTPQRVTVVEVGVDMKQSYRSYSARPVKGVRVRHQPNEAWPGGEHEVVLARSLHMPWSVYVERKAAEDVAEWKAAVLRSADRVQRLHVVASLAPILAAHGVPDRGPSYLTGPDARRLAVLAERAGLAVDRDGRYPSVRLPRGLDDYLLRGTPVKVDGADLLAMLAGERVDQ